MVSTAEESAFTFLAQGAIIQEFKVAGHNIVQGFSDPESYRTHNSPFFGATIGRTTNRIKNGRLDNLNGKSYTLATNNGNHSLHGGAKGWDKQTFTGPKPINRDGKEGVLFTYLSKDGDEGYPGTVEARVWYTAWKEDDAGLSKTILTAEYEIEFVGDECDETVVGITNHSYFNLSGASTIEGMEAQLATSHYLPIDDAGIPHGTIETYTSTDVEKPFVLGAREPDLDDCFVLDTDPSSIPLDTRSRPLKKLATFQHPITGIHLEVHSTEPAFQFYTGRFINVPAVGKDPAREPRSGFCVEPSRYVNAPGVPEWRNMCLLRKGEKFGQKTVYKAWKE
ncbi:putative aldose 1-epimerase [Phaeomoniella chlamydospora]|uniref:Putative aldose 1-epimerase n=1 Tax=Phaeomoniella chlamydospora TaxID=158046 RepID=A0A0G2E7X3_PHACM|nr:putative aldose 1-epimerase [Phaeomoniella chlamydospora]